LLIPILGIINLMGSGTPYFSADVIRGERPATCGQAQFSGRPMGLRNRFTDRGILIAAIFAAALLLIVGLFPYAHVVYPDAHDDATCPLIALVLTGALMLPALVALILLLRPLTICKLWRPAPVFNPVVLSFSSRAPPLS
jgi:hypothetical protein